MSQRHRIKVKPGKRRAFEGTSALEVHAKLGIGRPCDGCGAPLAIVKFTTFVLLTDLSETQRAAAAMLQGRDRLATVELKAGKAIMVGQQAACSRCRPALEKALARGPSYAFVDILEAPAEVMKQRVLVAVH